MLEWPVPSVAGSRAGWVARQTRGPGRPRRSAPGRANAAPPTGVVSAEIARSSPLSPQHCISGARRRSVGGGFRGRQTVGPSPTTGSCKVDRRSSLVRRLPRLHRRPGRWAHRVPARGHRRRRGGPPAHGLAGRDFGRASLGVAPLRRRRRHLEGGLGDRLSAGLTERPMDSSAAAIFGPFGTVRARQPTEYAPRQAPTSGPSQVSLYPPDRAIDPSPRSGLFAAALLRLVLRLA